MDFEVTTTENLRALTTRAEKAEAEVERLRNLALTVVGRFSWIGNEALQSTSSGKNFMSALDALSDGLKIQIDPPADCQWTVGETFRVFKNDVNDKHSPWYLAMPGGSMLVFNHHSNDDVDAARALWCAASLNAALLSSKLYWPKKSENRPPPVPKEVKTESEAYQQSPYPMYKCHKKVNAYQIGAIQQHNDVSVLLIPVAEEGKPTPMNMMMSQAWVTKNEPQVGGYVVFYGDGHISYSPAKAFEDGYKLL